MSYFIVQDTQLFFSGSFAEHDVVIVRERDTGAVS